MAIKLQTDSVRAIAAFQKVTGTGARDCLVTDSMVYFLVEPGNLGRAIGRGGNSVRELRRVFDRPVKIFEYSGTLERMVRNMVPGANNIEIEGEEVRVSVPEEKRSEVIGRGGRNIKAVREFLSRHFRVNKLILRR